MNVFEYAKEQFNDYYGVKLNERAKHLFTKFTETYSEGEILTAIDISCEEYADPLDALMKIGGILYNRALHRRLYFKGEDE